jgi:hypothetical protein
MTEMRRRGVECIEYTHGHIRALTHYGIDRADIERALLETRSALQAAGLAPATV